MISPNARDTSLRVCHRDLKDCYFTVLEVYSAEQLAAQRALLQGLLDDGLRQASQRKSNKDKLRCIGTSSGNGAGVSAAAAVNEKGQSRNRRNTLRKQIDRIDVLLAHKRHLAAFDTSTDSTSSGVDVNANTAATADTQSSTASDPAAVSALTATETVDNNDAAVLDAEQAAVLKSPGLLNPKSRGGWGFWRS